MKERPILFSGEMVRAVLEGRKTQTRRLNGLARINENPDAYFFSGFDYINDHIYAVFEKRGTNDIESLSVKCPFGIPGDQLWVKETHYFIDNDSVVYRADGECEVARWTPSIFMPRKASRINLEITDIRVERLKDITEEDARSEGVRESVPDGFDIDKPMRDQPFPVYKHSFSKLWESINGLGSWYMNPWVWVIEFRRLK